MRAVVLSEFGPPGNLVPSDVAGPVPGPDQALIDVQVANITFVETQIRAGRAPNPAMLPQLPAILGNGVGGADRTGQRVVAATGGTGGYAERAVASAACSCNAGARVIGAAGGPRKTAVAADLGADTVADYSAVGWASGVGAADVVFDGVGGEIGRASFGLVRQGGRFISYGLSSGAFTVVDEAEAAQRGVTVIRGVRVTPEQSRELSARALAEAAAGRLRPLIGQTFPLERAADAHAAIESRQTIGKTLLIV